MDNEDLNAEMHPQLYKEINSMADKKTDKRAGLPPELVAFNRCVVALQKLTDEQQQKARALLDAYLGPRQGFLVGELMMTERIAELVDPAFDIPAIDSKEG